MILVDSRRSVRAVPALVAALLMVVGGTAAAWSAAVVPPAQASGPVEAGAAGDAAASDSAPVRGADMQVPDAGSPVQGDTRPDILLFAREGCPHCADAKVYLDGLRARRPGLEVEIRDVVADAAALRLLETLARERGIRALSVPAFLIGDRLLVGFSDPETTGPLIEAALAGAGDGADGVGEGEAGPGCRPVEPCGPDEVRIPILGLVDVSRLGLPAFTLVLGLLDGFNPCAMWVLVFILSILVNLKSRARMLLIGGIFIAISGLVYFAFMAAWLNVFLLIGMARGIQIALGAVAVTVGAINTKDFWAMGRGPSLRIPESARPGIYARARRILQAENLFGAIGTVVVLAALVNTVELLCTAGLPAVYTQVLSLQGLSGLEYYGYLALYNVAYMADDSLVLIAAVWTLSQRRLQEREGRWLKLVSGVVMLLLGLLLLLRPGWLSA